MILSFAAGFVTAIACLYAFGLLLNSMDYRAE
jgi:hypothetical protein